MNNMRAIITRTIIAASVALCAIVAVPALTFAAPDCNLRGANLTGADLSECDLTDANLFRAYLRDANLTDADLSRAILTDAILTNADFTDANLTGAFRRPGISRADMDGVKGLDTVKGLID